MSTSTEPPGPDDSRFSVTFTLPFSRRDVFRELCHEIEPLGLDFNAGLSVSVVQIGDDARFRFSTGFVRSVAGGDGTGTTISKLVALVPDERLQWELIEQRDCTYTLLGRDGGNAFTAVDLADVHAVDLALTPARPIGTEVTLRYHCDGVSGAGCLPELSLRGELCDAPRVAQLWRADMLRREYWPLPPR